MAFGLQGYAAEQRILPYRSSPDSLKLSPMPVADFADTFTTFRSVLDVATLIRKAREHDDG